MLSFRRLYSASGNTTVPVVKSGSGGGLLRKPPPVITAPWSRAKSHSTIPVGSSVAAHARSSNNGITVSSSSSSSPSNGGGGGIVHNGGSSSYYHYASSSSFFKRRWMERTAIAIVVLIAWAWIMVFTGMILYHGYQFRQKVHSSTITATVNSGGILETSQAVQAFAQEASKHQESRRQTEREQAQQIPPQPEDHGDVALSYSEKQPLVPHESPLLIFTCQRANYLRETLSDILKYIPPDCSIGCPVIVSQDGTDEAVATVIAEFQTSFATQTNGKVPLHHIHHKSALRRGSNSLNSYEALAIHYGWALNQVMKGSATAASAASSKVPLPQRILILEEDLHIAPDFFAYFGAMAPILDADTSLLAVSSFNDNGFQSNVKDATRVLRSDFFPGLGWMMTRRLWTTEFQIKWPSGYWDDWLRLPAQRQGRHILHPEISRTFHFGVKGGASQNQFGDSLGQVRLNKEAADWTAKPARTDTDASNHWSFYLQSKDTYDRYYWSMVEPATLATTVADAFELTKEHDARIEYTSHAEFQALVHQLHPPLMDDEKAGIHRTAYHGIVETRPHGNHILFLTPPLSELRIAFTGIIAAEPSEKVEKAQ